VLRRLLDSLPFGDGDSVAWSGVANERGRTVHYRSLAHLRRDRQTRTSFPRPRHRIAQNYLDETFTAHRGPKLFVLSEPPTYPDERTARILAAPGTRPFTYLYDERDVERRMFYPGLRRIKPRHLRRLAVRVEERRPGRCCVVNRWDVDPARPLLAERVRFARAMGDDVDIYGHEPWEGENGWRAFPRYRGSVEDKKTTIARYDFVLAFENSDSFGYVTEKLPQALAAGCVPLYWGGGGALADCVPPDCYVDCRGRDPEEIHRLVVETPHERVVEWRRAGLRFLRSPAARRFTRGYLLERIVGRLRAQDAGPA
jgi:hypothetical protein